jgi:hypothetical protein
MLTKDKSQHTRLQQLRAKNLYYFQTLNPTKQLEDPRGIKSSSTYSELKTYQDNTLLNQTILYEPFSINILNGNLSVSESVDGLTLISFIGITDSGGFTPPNPTVLDDANVPLPLDGMVFNFFGANYSANIFWNTNNALIFGTMNPNIVSISSTTIPSILLGNYDRAT